MKAQKALSLPGISWTASLSDQLDSSSSQFSSKAQMQEDKAFGNLNLGTHCLGHCRWFANLVILGLAPTRVPAVAYHRLLGQKSCRPKVPRIFINFVPNFAPNFAPNFPRSFRGFFVLRFVGNGDKKKFTKNPRHFSMQNSQANTKKIFTKCFWRAGKVTDCRKPRLNMTKPFRPEEPRRSERVANQIAGFDS